MTSLYLIEQHVEARSDLSGPMWETAVVAPDGTRAGSFESIFRFTGTARARRLIRRHRRTGAFASTGDLRREARERGRTLEVQA